MVLSDTYTGMEEVTVFEVLRPLYRIRSRSGRVTDHVPYIK